ncbi:MULTISPECIES: ABC transporter permease [Pseudonocardia]|uniref:Inner membrane ABC transporter permease protein YdcU n=2 Tax=Pseudonocardia TaxID=1847 RepID=A0A1Y2MKN5_PSEAH|nr:MULTISPECIES: iron ABC transporter permease [Pseudonocardia]OSY35825.1 Inner membrane ABC transporter permease protein YdcU [Pseudonocardia autotrophica]TDN73119.1 iron(III) transport system permease protein [Pseudonocardia autotrophica]BBG03838.1 ABC transporter substrate-binding protein [Pseudonocardia autotrophica]GEC27363.1 ABC transporter substrate-binding protein [Pseudonocardia saturnea]
MTVSPPRADRPVEAPPDPARRTGRPARRHSGWKASGPLLAILAFLILIPAGLVLFGAFSVDVPRPGSIGLDLTLENFAVLAEPEIRQASLNSLIIATGASLLAVLLGAGVAFLAARTDVPARPFVYLVGLTPMFLPSYVGALAWSMLGSPGAGLLNILFRDLGIGLEVNLYSLGGLVFVMGMYYAPYAFLLVHASMSMMNPDLEEAAVVHGGTHRRMVRSVTVPLALPAILGSALLVFVLVFENFPVAQVLASPGSIDTIPTYIYRMMNTYPSRGNEAAALAVVLVAVVLIVTWLQRRALAKRSYTTVSGKGVKAGRIRLGGWRWPAFGIAAVYFALAVVLPLLALALTSVRRSPYIGSLSELFEEGALDLSAYGAGTLGSFSFWSIVGNSVLVAVGAAAFGTILSFLVAYVVYRTRARGRGALEGISMTPLAVPAIVLGMGLLWTWLMMPVQLYGTLWVLVVAFVAVQMPQGLRSVAASIQSTDRDLEDAAVLLGARRRRAITAVTVPLMRTALSATFLLLLMLSMRELTVPLFLYTNDTKILSIAIFDQFENGGALHVAAAMSLLYCLIMFVLSYLPRRFGKGLGE